jgi:hypothetical protein
MIRAFRTLRGMCGRLGEGRQGGRGAAQRRRELGGYAGDVPVGSDRGEPVFDDLAEPRELTDGERDLLAVLVAATGSPHIAAQLPTAQVSGTCRCGCSSIRLTARASAMPPAAVLERTPGKQDDYVAVTAEAAAGVQEPVAVTLHIVDGSLHELEIFAGEGQPVTTPPATSLRDISLSS